MCQVSNCRIKIQNYAGVNCIGENMGKKFKEADDHDINYFD